MDDYKLKYEQLKREYESYQHNTEYRLQNLSSLNMYLEKNINILSNIVEISNYVNSFVSSENLMATINDMIIGILGVTHSTVYILEEQDFIIKATSLKSEIKYNDEKCVKLIQNRREFVLNSEASIVTCDDNTEIHSVMGIPIGVGDKFIGYIIVMHSLYNFFTDDHRVFLTSIASQVAIAIENSILYNKIQKAAEMDPLIGIYNRKTFFEIVHKDLLSNPKESYTIIMADFDDFKMLNDTLGHQFGDETLIQTATLISSYLDETDIFARYGGEELIIYVPNEGENKEVTYSKIDDIRIAISKNIIKYDGNEKAITSSFGLGFYPNDGDCLDEVIKAADRRLYIAKTSGKNRVVYNK